LALGESNVPEAKLYEPMTDEQKIESGSLDWIILLRDKLVIIETWFFTQRRMGLYASGAIVAYAIGLVARWFQHSWLFFPDGKQSCNDFAYHWVSGVLAGSGDRALVYDFSIFSATRAALGGGDACMAPVLNQFVYPPTILFFTYPLGLLPYITGFAAWMVVTLLLYLVAIYLIVPRPIAILVALSPFPVFFNIFLGQNGFLLAGLMGLSLVLMERRPRLSGLLLGLLTFKPQIGILFPFALVVSRKWRVIVSAAATSVVLIVTSAVIFGYQGWLSFIRALVDRGPTLSPISEISMRLESVYGFLWSAGINPPIAWALQSAVAGSVAAVVWWIWASPLPHSLKAAALCGAAPMATPYVHGHDLCILAIAGAFLVKDGLTRGFLPGDRLIMLFSWIAIFLGFRDFSIGWIPCLALLALVVRWMPNRSSIELRRFYRA
jgi:arabinofuranan 3-O-arabinosyltransferase